MRKLLLFLSLAFPCSAFSQQYASMECQYLVDSRTPGSYAAICHGLPNVAASSLASAVAMDPAPTSPPPKTTPIDVNGGYSRVELSVGYIYYSLGDPGGIGRTSLHGAYFDGTYNLLRNVGVEFGVDGSHVNASGSRFGKAWGVFYGAGIRVTPWRGKWNPYAHALFGANTTIPDLSSNQTRFAFEVGGGLNLRLHNRLGLRVLRLDYEWLKFSVFTFASIKAGAGLTF